MEKEYINTPTDSNTKVNTKMAVSMDMEHFSISTVLRPSRAILLTIFPTEKEQPSTRKVKNQ
jgi:hypothetical protein